MTPNAQRLTSQIRLVQRLTWSSEVTVVIRLVLSDQLYILNLAYHTLLILFSAKSANPPHVSGFALLAGTREGLGTTACTQRQTIDPSMDATVGFSGSATIAPALVTQLSANPRTLLSFRAVPRALGPMPLHTKSSINNKHQTSQ
jgi:hypothetical protein